MYVVLKIIGIIIKMDKEGWQDMPKRVVRNILFKKIWLKKIARRVHQK